MGALNIGWMGGRTGGRTVGRTGMKGREKGLRGRGGEGRATGGVEQRTQNELDPYL